MTREACLGLAEPQAQLTTKQGAGWQEIGGPTPAQAQPGLPTCLQKGQQCLEGWGDPHPGPAWGEEEVQMPTPELCRAWLWWDS